MSLNSVNTNQGAMIALQSLNTTNTQLQVTQRQISTGYRVASASDDGAAFSIAQGIRSTVGSLTSANQQLGNAQGLLQVTDKSLTNVSNMMASMRSVLVKLGDGNTTANDHSNYVTQYKSLLSNLKTFVQDAGYNGKTLIGNVGGASLSQISVVRNESGGTYGLSTFSGSALYGSLALATSYTQTQAHAAVTTGGTFMSQQNKVGQALNKLGSSINYVSSQITYNNNKIDALNSGLGSLVDADLAKESAQLTALQIRQQLGTQALSMANSAPQSLMSLFR